MRSSVNAEKHFFSQECYHPHPPHYLIASFHQPLLVLDKSSLLREKHFALIFFFHFFKVLLQNSDLSLSPPLLALSFKSLPYLPSLYCKAFSKAV